MYRKLYLKVFAFILINHLLSACSDGSPKAEEPIVEANLEDDYNARISKIIPYLKTEHGINMDSCKSIVILQTNKCNSCSREKLDSIFADLTRQPKQPVVFVLHDDDKQVGDYIQVHSQKENIQKVIDKERKLSKFGLSFMKNIFVSTCKDKVLSWKFYE